MANKVAIVTDSIACLTREHVEQYGIKIAPLNFYFGDKMYRDWVDITPTQAYELFLKDPDSFKSSAALPEGFLEAFRELGNQTRDIFCVTLSAKVSTTYNVACVAKEQIKAELPQTSIEVLDSETVAVAEAFVVLAAARAAEEGKSLAEVVKAAREVKDKISFIALLDTIRHVYRTGRIPKIAARVGAILNIKPMLHISSGLLKFSGAVRSREGGIKRMLKMMRDKVGQSLVHVAVMHAYALDEAQKLKERISAEFNCAELWITEMSPLMGYATGTGTLGLAFYSDS